MNSTRAEEAVVREQQALKAAVVWLGHVDHLYSVSSLGESLCLVSLEVEMSVAQASFGDVSSEAQGRVSCFGKHTVLGCAFGFPASFSEAAQQLWLVLFQSVSLRQRRRPIFKPTFRCHK